ncbi:toprim domain-containing protein [Adhaeribacter swui]|uniref:Toprim domain-containing protein n=1 Tax=Adhaeribacter swui TaxID=2086471 RepID=A0A7G7GB05_9BACT|nr:toprim domain-containing protein [Adhaeribacter swui]QNF34339.1 toprim domain-containing protein [Adhaeribacter swui]
MKQNKKELNDIKSTSIVSFLASLGIFPQYKSGNEHYYLSPFRQEKTPSFTVNEQKNCWFDHGQGVKGTGGDIISLLQQVLKLEFNEAVELITQLKSNPELAGLDPKSFLNVAPAEKEYKSTLTLTYAGPIVNPILTKYLQSRGINLDLLSGCQDYLRQVHYKIAGKEKTFYGIGFKNSSGGYEVRSHGFQSFIGPKKDVTYIKGTRPGIAVFEGFLDYLSALTHHKRTSLQYDILILNSTRMLKSAMPILLSHTHVHTFLDNDFTGLQATDLIQAKCKEKGIAVTRHNSIYQGYKDFNDYLTKTAPTKPLPGTTNDSMSEASKDKKWWLWVVFREMQFTKEGVGFTNFTWYSFNNDRSGYQQLLHHRQDLEKKIKYFRLCERTSGRNFKILEEGHV